MESNEQSYWVQQIAPAGNYYDVLGTPLSEKGLQSAKDYVNWTREQGFKSRIVLRTDVVIDPAP